MVVVIYIRNDASKDYKVVWIIRSSKTDIWGGCCGSYIVISIFKQILGLQVKIVIWG